MYATVILNKLEALQIFGSSDLSGSIVIANKAVSVISGSYKAKPTGSEGYFDMLVSFLLPTNLWGKQYILNTVRSTDKKKGDIFRIFAYKNNTVVRSANWMKALSPGKFTELDLEDDLASFVNCSKPCQVVQYIRGESLDGKYVAPSMVVLPSVNQFQSYYRVVFPFGSEYQHSVTVVIENEYSGELYVNGINISSVEWEKINGTKYVCKALSFSAEKSVTIYHSSPVIEFGLIVFGWNIHVSYAYPGGFAFSNLSACILCSSNIYFHWYATLSYKGSFVNHTKYSGSFYLLYR